MWPYVYLLNAAGSNEIFCGIARYESARSDPAVCPPPLKTSPALRPASHLLREIGGRSYDMTPPQNRSSILASIDFGSRFRKLALDRRKRIVRVCLLGRST